MIKNETIARIVAIGNVLVAFPHIIYFYDMSQGAAPVVQNSAATAISIAGIIISGLLIFSSALQVLSIMHTRAGLTMLASLGGLTLLDGLFWIQEMDWALNSTHLDFPYDVVGRIIVAILALSWLTLNYFVVFKDPVNVLHE